MKDFRKALLLSLLLPLFSMAQSNYRPGSVVNLKGDTLHGFIDYKEWENNPASISFKTTLNEAVQQFTPNDITYFKIEHLEAYRRYSGAISTDETNINKISTGRDTSFIIAILFLKIEQEGKYITLYSYSDDVKTRYFVQEQTSNQPVELIRKTYFSPTETNKTINEDRYKGQLIYLASKYDSNNDQLKATIENSSYNQDLIAIANKINQSTSKAITHKKAGISFYAGISTGITHITPPSNDVTYRANYEYVNSYLPRIFFGMNVYTNPEVGRLVFKGEIAIGANSFKTYFNEYYYYDTKSYITLDQYTFSIAPQVLYNIYNSTSFKFYLEAGVSLNLSAYSNNEYHNGVFGMSVSNYIETNAIWFSVPLSAGVMLNSKIGIFITYVIPSVITQDNFEYHSTQIGVTYTFGAKK